MEREGMENRSKAIRNVLEFGLMILLSDDNSMSNRKLLEEIYYGVELANLKLNNIHSSVYSRDRIELNKEVTTALRLAMKEAAITKCNSRLNE
ncbi:hypothetical protein N9R79_11850, partial [Vibrio sp.]|nr:hypothetical protein [Vibrio sp.]